METVYRVVGSVRRAPKPEPPPPPPEPDVVRLPDPEVIAAQDTALQALDAANAAILAVREVKELLPQLLPAPVDLRPLAERISAVEQRPLPAPVPVAVPAEEPREPDWQFSNGEVRVRSAGGQWGPWMKLHADPSPTLGPLAIQQLVRDYLITNPPVAPFEVVVSPTDPGGPPDGFSRVWIQTFPPDPTAFDLKFWRP